MKFWTNQYKSKRGGKKDRIINQGKSKLKEIETAENEECLCFTLHAQPEIPFLKRLLRAYPDGTLLLSEKGTYEILMQKLKCNKNLL